MHVHCGSLARDGDAGVDTGFRFTFTFCLFGGSSLSEYDEEAFRENLKDGDCNTERAVRPAPCMPASRACVESRPLRGST